LLIIFYRNPRLGKVRDRACPPFGDSKALAIYLYLASQTRTITETLDADEAVFIRTMSILKTAGATKFI
jgi:hypothetical protein